MPPSEHRLIHELMVKDAKVLMASDYGDFAWWFVVRGKRPSSRVMLAIYKMLAEMIDDEPEPTADPDPPASIGDERG